MEENQFNMEKIISNLSDELNRIIESENITIEEFSQKTGMGITYIKNIVEKDFTLMPKCIKLTFISDICKKFNIKIEKILK